MTLTFLFMLALLVVSSWENAVISNDVSVSPGRYDLRLGEGFPTFGPVKLSYPNSTILTDSVGDLLFTVTLGLNSSLGHGRSSVSIYIPPDFSGLTIGKVWTSFTNNYDPHSLSLSRLSASDRVGPNWWEITVNNLFLTTYPDQANSMNATFLANQTQYVRVFQLTSPVTAGRYFFKAFINGTSIGAENFPTIVVKGSRDPAYISGVLRESGEHDPLAAGRPINLTEGTGARILATGIDYLGRPASAQTFINSTAAGNYTLFGVAPGTYNITAYAAGYIPSTMPYTVSVGPTQSLEAVDIYLTKSVNITGTVLSESAEGSLVPWGKLFSVDISGHNRTIDRSISVKVVNLAGSVVASIPAPYGFGLTTTATATTFDFKIQHEVGFDGRIPQDFADYTSGLASGDYLLYAYVTSYVQLAEVRVHVGNETTKTISLIPLIRTGMFNVTVHFRNFNSTMGEDQIPINATLTVSAYDQRGTLRAQNVTFVPAGATSATVELQGFSNSRSFGVSSLFSQNYGLLPGTYQIVAQVTSSPSFAGYANIGIRNLYYQTQNFQATIGLGEGVVIVSLPVYKAGGLLLNILSINQQIPPISRQWAYANSTAEERAGATINILIIGSDGTIYQANATQLNLVGNPRASGNVSFTYIGLPTDTYDVVVQTLGYTQREILHVRVVLGGNSDAAIWMIENPVIDLTVVFRHEGLLSNIDSTLPFAQPINHITGTPARIEVFDSFGDFVAANVSYIPNSLHGIPVRYANFTLAGFNRYFGDPRFIWSGFYDTTDAVSQSPGGLFLYPWDDSPREFIVRIWVEGYYQTEQLHVLVPSASNVSVVEGLDRASRIAGNVTGPDFFDIARPLSWATITLEPNNYTLTRIIDVRPGNYTTFSLDGSFQVWVPEGTYGMGVSLGGYATYSTQIYVPTGSDMNMDIWLDNYQLSPAINTSVSIMASPAPYMVGYTTRKPPFTS